MKEVGLLLVATGCATLLTTAARGQSIAIPWIGFAHSPQHSANAPTNSQTLTRTHWTNIMDYAYPGEGIHYGSPLITRSNTTIVPVKTGANSFEVRGVVATNGAVKWTQTSDYTLPPWNWIPAYSPALTPKNRLFYPGAGGTVYYCDTPDASNAVVTGQMAFYGLSNYLANSNAYKTSVFINTPITSDRYGNIFFGFVVTNSNPLNLTNGLARIDYTGTGTWIAASSMVTNASVRKVVNDCSPALSNDHKTLYVAVNNASLLTFDGGGTGYLVSLDSRSLTPLTSARLYDVANTNNNAEVLDETSASPTIGPDGDVYYGVLETTLGANHDRGWLLHFDSTLTHMKLPGPFGWDSTVAIVPTNTVPSYTGGSPYLLAGKFNNSTGGGGNGNEYIGIFDPQQSMTDPISGKTVMNVPFELLGYVNNDEWCVNSPVVDPFTQSILSLNEDGHAYRWNLAADTITQTNRISGGYYQGYTPSVVGVDGTVYIIDGGVLYAVGQ
jgi:hypothetical protein